MGKRPLDPPADEYRCTSNAGKRGRRCSQPRLPGVTLCRNHYLENVSPSKTISVPSSPAASPVRPFTLLSDGDARCSKNDGRGWRCHHPCLPGYRSCDKHQRPRPNQRPAASPSASEENPSPPAVDLKSPKSMPEEKPPSPPVVVEVGEASAPPNVAAAAAKVGEIWALPDTAGGPPRAYARVDRIIQSSMEAVVTPLVPHPVTDEEIRWLDDGRTLACGTFRACRHSATVKNLSLLSHRVVCTEVGSSHTFFKILLIAGEVWAVYDELEPGAMYHLAEIVSSFTEEDGVTAVPLVAAEGAEGVLRRQLCGRYELRRTFWRKDLLWFSHRVPAIRMEAAGCGGSMWKVIS